MPRPRKRRRVHRMHQSMRFSPESGQSRESRPVVLRVDELESLRMMDLEGMDQKQCAEMMGLGRTTFQRLLHEARRKVALALTESRPIEIEGLDRPQDDIVYHCPDCEEDFDTKHLKRGHCPHCSD